MPQPATDSARYTTITRALATRALSMAVDASPFRAAKAERRWSMVQAIPAARIVLGSAHPGDAEGLADAAEGLCQTLAHEAGKVTDGFGHHRPVYTLLSLHLLGSAAQLAHKPEVTAAIKHAVEPLARFLTRADPDPRLAAWHKLLALQHYGKFTPDVYGESTRDAEPLLPHRPEDLIDTWTYHELLGIHALHLWAAITGDEAGARRVRSAAAYHVGHTQPDYTTYQPWGLAAFAEDAEAATFAEQQLHDVQTHLAIEGPGGALLPGLLLADAVASLDGRMGEAWRRYCFQG